MIFFLFPTYVEWNIKLDRNVEFIIKCEFLFLFSFHSLQMLKSFPFFYYLPSESFEARNLKILISSLFCKYKNFGSTTNIFIMIYSWIIVSIEIHMLCMQIKKYLYFFFFKCHTRFRASVITIDSILFIVIFLGKFFTGVVSHCFSLDLLRRLSFLTKMKIVLTRARFDSEWKCLRHCSSNHYKSSNFR